MHRKLRNFCDYENILCQLMYCCN